MFNLVRSSAFSRFVSPAPEGRRNSKQATSCGKLCAHFRRHAGGPASSCIDRAPQRSSFRQCLPIAVAPNFSESFECDASGFADPGPQEDFITKRGGGVVINLVPQNDSANSLLRLRAGQGSPVRRGNLLYPSQVNRIIDVILLVDVVGQNHVNNTVYLRW